MVIEWVSIVMEVPPNGWFLLGKIPSFEMDDDWGYPYDSGKPHMFPIFFRKDLMLHFAEGGGVRLGYGGVLCCITVACPLSFIWTCSKKHQSKEDMFFYKNKLLPVSKDMGIQPPNKEIMK